MSRKVFDWLLAIFIFLIPTFYIPGNTFSYAQGNVLMIGAVVLFLVSTYLKPVRFRNNTWLNAMFSLALLVLLLGTQQKQLAMIEPFIKLCSAMVIFYVIVRYAENFEYLYNAVCGVVAISGVMVILQMCGVDPLCLSDSGYRNPHVTALFGYKMNLGAYMAMACPLLLFNKRWPFAIVALALVILSDSWASMGVVVIGLMFCVFFWKRKFFLPILIITTVLGGLLYSFLLYNPDSNHTFQYKMKVRMLYQTKLLEPILRKPFIGQGIGCFPYLEKELRYDYDLGNIDNPFNDYIERAIEMGVGILFLIAGLYWYVWKRFRDSIKSNELIGIMGALVTIPIGIFFHTYVKYPNLFVMCILLLALFEIKSKKEES